MSGTIMCPITDEGKQKHIHAIYCAAFGVDPTRVQHVPVDNPVSMDRTNIEYLKQEDYMVAYKANGTRYLLILTMYDRKPLAAMVDRAKAMYSTLIYATADHFKKNSVFDGELVLNQSNTSMYEFLVFNCLMAKGQRCAENSYRDRLDKVAAHFTSTLVDAGRREAMASMFILSRIHSLHLLRKEVEAMQNIRSFIRSVTPRYGYDGFIFTPVNRPVQPGRQESLLKWKSDNTIDVTLETRYIDNQWTPVEVLMEHNKGQLGSIGEIGTILFDMHTDRIQDILYGRFVYSRIFEPPSQPIVFSSIVEASCQCSSDKTIVLRYCRSRQDKDTPNNKVTIQRTLATIRDNIQLDELFRLALLRDQDKVQKFIV
jgi:hypothetical protein